MRRQIATVLLGAFALVTALAAPASAIGIDLGGGLTF